MRINPLKTAWFLCRKHPLKDLSHMNVKIPYAGIWARFERIWSARELAFTMVRSEIDERYMIRIVIASARVG